MLLPSAAGMLLKTVANMLLLSAASMLLETVASMLLLSAVGELSRVCYLFQVCYQPQCLLYRKTLIARI